MTRHFHFLSVAIILAIIYISTESELSAHEGNRPGMVIFMQACDSVERFMSRRSWSQNPIFIKTAYISNKGKKSAKLEIVACRDMAFFPFRDGDIEHIYRIFKEMMPAKYAQYRNRFNIRANNHLLKAYSPAYFSEKGAEYYISEHKSKTSADKTKQLVHEISFPFQFNSGLSDRHIAVWQSHGYYYNLTKKRWEWQRGRIFGTVEDLYTQSYVIPFLVPMLENAGAVVLMPRERDINVNEVIVDNDTPSSGYTEKGKWSTAPKKGFSLPVQPMNRENPFKAGSARQIHDSDGSCSARWQPEIPEDGEYSVYISYQSLPSSSDKARYTVHYDGGSRTFQVNQKIGGSTWVHLGKFTLKKGRRPNQYVELKCEGKNQNSVLTADAVKFGGGIGNVSRNATADTTNVSGKPRYMEGARYWLQWAGFNDSVYSPSAFMNDYKDDVKCRSLWVNSLIDDYNIPIDLSFAFHTDAGLRRNDSIVGTLAIHTWKYDGSIRYKNGERRFLGRDFADIVQTQVTNDVRSLFDSTWTRRGLWDMNYSECSSPQVPSMILEFLSHQNFNDMRYGLDPVFRFHVSRSVYKGITRFLSWLNDCKCIIQPLPVESFNVKIQNASGRNYAVLSWKSRKDPLEPTADPDRYVIYKRVDDGGFDEGTVVSSTNARIEIKAGHIYSFKVCAMNDGGMSFPSEVLCASLHGSVGKYAMIVNNFTRLSGPVSFMSPDSTRAGFRYDEDAGVPYVYDIAFCGGQYEYNIDTEWKSNDFPGFGASNDNYENAPFAGNTFDNVYRHSVALVKAGYGVVSSSRKSVMSGQVNLKDYPLVDIVCGKQKHIADAFGADRDYSVFPDELCWILTDYASDGRTIIVSGAHIASDCMRDGNVEARKFLEIKLKVKSFNHLKCNSGTISTKAGKSMNYFSEPNPSQYHIEKPEGLVPSGSKSHTILQYKGGNESAGVVFKSKDYKSAALSIPMEALKTQEQIDFLMEYVIGSLH